MSRKFKKPSKVVVSGEINQHRFVALLKKYWFVVVALFLAGGLAVGLALWFQARHKAPTKVVASSACTDKSANGILEQAKPLLTPSKVTQLQPVVEKIKSLPNYDTDPNCLGVVVTYYINSSDSKEARVYYDKLVAVYPTDKGYSELLGGKVATPIELKPTIVFLEGETKRQQDPNQKNTGASNSQPRAKQ